MGDPVNNGDEIGDDTYVSVELKINSTIVTIKRKRLMLKSEKNALYGERDA